MQENQQTEKKNKGTWGEVVRTFIWAMVIAMIFRSFLFQPFHIPSGSMKPTLLVGDYLVVSKYSYGYSRYSFPFGPHIFDGRIMSSEPKRGDIVVFKVPSRAFGEDVYIKRLIGLPGDKIQVKDRVLYINNEKVKLEDDGSSRDDHQNIDVKQFYETLPNGVKHWVWDNQRSNYDGYARIDPDNTDVYTVPKGYYFMMGDNRDDSRDSRFPEPGYVSAEDLIGRAEIILFSSDGQFWNPLKWRFERFFTLLRN